MLGYDVQAPVDNSHSFGGDLRPLTDTAYVEQVPQSTNGYGGMLTKIIGNRAIHEIVNITACAEALHG